MISIRKVENGAIINTGNKELVFTQGMGAYALGAMLLQMLFPNYERFCLVYSGWGMNKISVIKEMREAFALSLYDAKLMSECLLYNHHGSLVIAHNMTKTQADEMKDRFLKAGAEVEILPESVPKPHLFSGAYKFKNTDREEEIPF